MREITPPANIIALSLNTASQYGCNGHQPMSRREIIAPDGCIESIVHVQFREGVVRALTSGRYQPSTQTVPIVA